MDSAALREAKDVHVLLPATGAPVDDLKFLPGARDWAEKPYLALVYERSAAASGQASTATIRKQKRMICPVIACVLLLKQAACWTNG